MNNLLEIVNLNNNLDIINLNNNLEIENPTGQHVAAWKEEIIRLKKKCEKVKYRKKARCRQILTI